MDRPDLRKDDRDFYASSVDYFSVENRQSIQHHLATVELYIAAISEFLDEMYRRRKGDVNFVERGAGTCLTSLSLRKMYPQASFNLCGHFAIADAAVCCEIIHTCGGGR